MREGVPNAPTPAIKASASAADDAAIERLARALTFPTVSGYPSPAAPGAFSGFLDFVGEIFPSLFAAATVVREDPWRLVIELPGSDSSLLPVLMLGHFDVVGVQKSNEADWTHPPFSGTVADGYIWGRGAIDDKSSVMAILEAADRAVRDGQLPKRALVLAFGGDEELAGTRGAVANALEFRSAGRRFHFVLDEGSIIADGMFDDVDVPLALIGMAEKGHVNVTVTAHTEGGHAGRPPATTAVGIVSRAVARIEANPFPVRRLASIETFFRTVGKMANGMAGFAYRHPRLMWPLISRIMTKRPSTNAIVRTTQAVTMAEGSAAPNVLPHEASCVVNVRILPGDSADSVVSHYRALLRRIPVEVELQNPDGVHDPIPEAPSDHPGFVAIAESLASVAPEVLTVPFIVTDSTDSKYYSDLSSATLRFAPATLTAGDLPSVHGTNERITTANFLGMICFYSMLLEKVCWND